LAAFSFAQQKKLLSLLIILGVCLLLLASSFTWIYLKRIEAFYITDLKFRVQNITLNAQQMIDPSHLIELMQEEPGTPLTIYYQQLLYEILENNQLQTISIISPIKEILVTTSPDASLNAEAAFLNDTLIAQVLSGKMVVGEIQTLGRHKFLTAGAPLIDAGTNQLTGALILDVQANFFDILDDVNNSLILLSLLNGLLVLAAAVIFIRSFRRIINLQEQIKNQEHLVKLGEMAAAVAHEIRNPLGIIKGTHTLLSKRYQKENDELFTYIPAEIDRLNKLINDYLSFARSQTVHYRKTDLKELITKIKLGFGRTKNIKFSIEIPEKLTIINTDGSLLEQVLLNIVTNSYQAIEEEGEITIACSLSGKMITISICDTGSGISDKEMEKIFEPFHTTKENGSGLGLPIAKGIVDALGGSLSVSSKPGKGTRVILELPFIKDTEIRSQGSGVQNA
jgi:two-component system, sporulation sensor kinase D